jgi:hypothetical protein
MGLEPSWSGQISNPSCICSIPSSCNKALTLYHTNFAVHHPASWLDSLPDTKYTTVCENDKTCTVCIHSKPQGNGHTLMAYVTVCCYSRSLAKLVLQQYTVTAAKRVVSGKQFGLYSLFCAKICVTSHGLLQCAWYVEFAFLCDLRQ